MGHHLNLKHEFYEKNLTWQNSPCPALLSSNPERVRGANLLGTLASRRAAGTAREEPQPDSNPSQFWL